MTTSPPISLSGCRHDILGHALKAIGVLRAISLCAACEDRDPEAEGWWDPDTASFMLRSSRYPDVASLVKFFAEKYQPTPMIAPWNKSGGVTDRITVIITGEADDLHSFVQENSSALKELGLTAGALKKRPLSWSPDASAFAKIKELLPLDARLELRLKISIEADVERLRAFKSKHEDRLDLLGLPIAGTVPRSGKLTFTIRWQDVDELQNLLREENLPPAKTRKESEKKDGTLPSVQKLLSTDPVFRECLDLARVWADELQGSGETDAMVRYRDQLPGSVSESLDALATVHLSRHNDNPLFVNRGQQGSTDVFLVYWGHFISFCKHTEIYSGASLFGERVVGSDGSPAHAKGKGTPFFPDAIKNYNQGLEWVTDTFPFCPLDYLLAVEGAFAMRGAVSKSLHAQSRSFAAFPFVFEGEETMIDDQGKVTGLGASFWFPIWTHPTTFGELQSFILDSQARLPKKDCRFSSDFARAVRSLGVDAGFDVFQEFRFKMKGARVPWAVSGRFVPCSATTCVNVMNELLAPIDAAGFLDQFRFRTRDEVKRERKADLHPLRAPVLEAIGAAVAEPDALRLLNVLSGLATLNAQLARSRSLRDTVGGGRVAFVPPLRCDDWSTVLRDLEDDPEFQIARALASIRGHEKQADGTYSDVEPFQGSLVPLRLKHDEWDLPVRASPEAVWTGIDLTRDLAAVLARRVLDSAKDARPAIVGTCTARLPTILQFLRGELDDRRIGTLIEALSLIDWRFQSRRSDTSDNQTTADECFNAVPVAYAAMRSLLEIACESKLTRDIGASGRSGPRAVVARAIALASSLEPRMLASATAEALRRLAIVGVPNPYDEKSQREKPRLAGRDVIQLDRSLDIDSELACRLPAAILIPLDWRDRWTLFRAITLPQTTR